MKRRVVITGMGIVSSLGNNLTEVVDALKKGHSGISYAEDYEEKGFRSHVFGDLKINTQDYIDRKVHRFMGQAAAYAYISMQEAINDAALTESIVSNERTGLLAGSGGGSNIDVIESADLLRKHGIKKLGPYRVPRTMSSTTSACIVTFFKIKGIAYSISSACATSAHCIGEAYEKIASSKQDVMFAGGGEELDWSLSMLFDAMGALSSSSNHDPIKACRPFDKARDGFVISGGGGMLVLENLEHALKRGAKIYAEIVGYGATSDGFNMVQPSGQGAIQCMKQALAKVNVPIDYINAHGTGTQVGDIREVMALAEVFKKSLNKPLVSSTKSWSGHSLGAASVHEAIYSLLMLKNQFVVPTNNLENPLYEVKNANIDLISEKRNVPLKTIMSNSFGFGGVNATLVFQQYND